LGTLLIRAITSRLARDRLSIAHPKMSVLASTINLSY
jgi:hypothetical protein